MIGWLVGGLLLLFVCSQAKNDDHIVADHQKLNDHDDQAEESLCPAGCFCSMKRAEHLPPNTVKCNRHLDDDCNDD